MSAFVWWAVVGPLLGAVRLTLPICFSTERDHGMPDDLEGNTPAGWTKPATQGSPSEALSDPVSQGAGWAHSRVRPAAQPVRPPKGRPDSPRRVSLASFSWGWAAAILIVAVVLAGLLAAHLHHRALLRQRVELVDIITGKGNFVRRRRTCSARWRRRNSLRR